MGRRGTGRPTRLMLVRQICRSAQAGSAEQCSALLANRSHNPRVDFRRLPKHPAFHAARGQNRLTGDVPRERVG